MTHPLGSRLSSGELFGASSAWVRLAGNRLPLELTPASKDKLMIARRNFLTLLGAGMATGRLGFSQSENRLNGHVASDDHSVAIPDPCRDTLADPPWKHLSSANGDLPVPQTSDQQPAA